MAIKRRQSVCRTKHGANTRVRTKHISAALNVPVTKLCDDYYMFVRYPYSKKLKELRAEHGLTQGELGKMLGVAAKSVARWEQGRAVVTREQWKNLHRLFHSV